MKEYCVDLEIAKELKENRFPQNNCMNYFTNFHQGFDDGIFVRGYCEIFDNFIISYFNGKDKEIPDGGIYYSAPTSDEILKELPEKINDCYYLDIIKMNDEYKVGYSNIKPYDQADFQWIILREGKKLSNVLSTLWLYLKKEGYIK